MEKVVDFEVFMKMLHELDDLLYDDHFSIEVRAIGGFAMMLNAHALNIIARNASADVDLLTHDWPILVEKKILQIGKKYGVNGMDGWLNNHWNHMKFYEDELEQHVEWQLWNGDKFHAITLFYADLESLFCSKQGLLTIF